MQLQQHLGGPEVLLEPENSPGWSRLMCFFSSDDVTKLELHCGWEHLYGVSPGRDAFGA